MNWFHWSRIVLRFPDCKKIFSYAVQNHQESPQEVPNLYLQIDFKNQQLLFNSSNTLVLLRSLKNKYCKMGIHMTKGQRSNTIVYYNFDKKLEKKIMSFVTFFN